MLLQALDKLYNEYKLQIDRVYGQNLPLDEKKGKYDGIISEFKRKADELIGEE
ncbi:Uncharacterised protein [Candidatus Burarchaeum australiense]|nr:Uncharacterised protein [Candidatus Burarchaeum australiense]